MQTNTEHNRLIEEESPYLRQHAENPVDWYPWGIEAFEKAREEDKPVFLSIGYSTCHWCHVMAEESFEDEKVADLLNENFVSIKVDREERPDIDSIYMQVCQLMNGHGGWPLSIFMTPDKKPFYAATYIPKEGRGRRTGMLELLPAISRLWREDRERLLDSAKKITEAVRGNENRGPGGKQELDEKIFSRACSRLEAEYDEENGGFGSSPKFPMSHRLLFLCDFSREEGENLPGKDDSPVEATGEKCERYRAMTEKTLQSMRSGGIYDQLGFGFHRYSTDEKWKVPHFEKMLYDQALLIKAYLAGYQITGKEVYAETVEEIIEYISRDMRSPQGGFYSAEDADSEGVEGKFYLWEKEEVEQHLAPEQAEAFIDTYNIEPRGNFRDEATGKLTGENILYLLDIEDSGRKGLRESRRKLFAVREERVHPHKDKKILTDWNGLMITALARAAFILENEDYLDLAADTVAFIRDKMLTSGGRLLHRYGGREEGGRRGEIGAFLDDYAFLIQGLIELYQASFEVEYLQLALELQEQLDENFRDREAGGYYFNAHDAEELLTREKPVYDGVVPSGNSVALWNLIRFFHITGDVQYRDRAEQMVDSFAGSVKNAPTGHLQFLRSCRDYLDSFFSIVIVGEAGASGVEQMKKVLRENYLPNKVVIFKPVNGDNGKDGIEEISGYLTDFEMKDNKTTVYVCDNLNCELPTTDVEEMAEILRMPAVKNSGNN